MNNVIAVFESTHAAIEGERACLAAGIKCQAIPLPREISAGCGIALEIPDSEAAAAEALLHKTGIAASIRRR
ncbi:MAG TPA: DUF3343 domain-containing protein [Chitinivibrionales bacterium]|jgi:hypothetical protein|nr:DUF3343 domain-containing protein [Chitinivibrionales bacterium]